MASKIVLIAFSLLVFFASISIREKLNQAPVEAHSQQQGFQRIVSMAPSITETIYALGLEDLLVGVTRYCKYPPAAANIPKVGGFLDPNFEAIVALKPDLVILLEEHQRSLPGFQKLGLKTHIVCHKNIKGIIDSMRSIARICGEEDKGKKIADKIQSRLDRIREKTAGTKRPRIMIAVDRIPGTGGLVDVYIAGRDGFFDKMIELAGGENVYHQGSVRYPVVSAEGIMHMNPDVIIDLVSGLNQEHFRVADTLSDWHFIGDVEAVKQRRVYAFDRDYATVPGPRIIQIVEDLARLLHPEIDGNGP
ncbi:MAG TPA: helical backbone metal receptor [Thermoguttaceae bacterium]